MSFLHLGSDQVLRKQCLHRLIIPPNLLMWYSNRRALNEFMHPALNSLNLLWRLAPPLREHLSVCVSDFPKNCAFLCPHLCISLGLYPAVLFFEKKKREYFFFSFFGEGRRRKFIYIFQTLSSRVFFFRRKEEEEFINLKSPPPPSRE